MLSLSKMQCILKSRHIHTHTQTQAQAQAQAQVHANQSISLGSVDAKGCPFFTALEVGPCHPIIALQSPVVTLASRPPAPPFSVALK